MKRSYVVTVNPDAPRNKVLSQREVMRYIQDAVSRWGSYIHSDDPLFGLCARVTVRPKERYRLFEIEECGRGCIVEWGQHCLLADDPDSLKCFSGTPPKECPLRKSNFLLRLAPRIRREKP